MFFALSLQASVLGLLALATWIMFGWFAALSMLYGGGVALTNSGLLVWRWRRGLTDFHCDGGRHLKAFHRSSLERFFVVAILLAAGMAGLGLQAPVVLAGFIAGQIAWVIAAAVLKTN